MEESTETEKAQDYHLELGNVSITPEAADAAVAAGRTVQEFIDRHASGDWGDIGDHARAMNEYAARFGWRVQSSYALGKGHYIRIRTSMTRNTEVLLVKDGE